MSARARKCEPIEGTTRVYRGLLATQPDHVASLVGLSQILLDRDDLDGAGAAVDRALQANPQSAPALQQRILVDNPAKLYEF